MVITVLVLTFFLLTCQYHVGYQEQMSHWPELPVNVIIKWLKDREPSYIVADFGCGEASVPIRTRGCYEMMSVASGSLTFCFSWSMFR